MTAVESTDTPQPAAPPDLLEPSRWQGRLFTGRWTDAPSGTSAVVEPATGAELARVGTASAADVTRSAEAAAVLEAHSSDIEHWLIREGGAVPAKAAFEIGLVLAEFHEAAALPSQPLGEILPSTEPRLSWAQRVPAGVVGVISPFNFPLILAARSVAPALALGNAVVLKPDPRTAVCGGVALARIFEEAGLPEGVLHVLPGGVEAGESLITDPRVRIISFTGSTAAGRRVGALAAQNLKRVHLELGGNSALIVLDDADLGAAVSAGAWGTFLHQGQICMTTGRHLVHESLYEDYAAALAEKANGLPVGDPKTGQVALGPLIDARQRDRVHSLVTGSVAAGARLAAGGTYEGLFYRPTVLAGAEPGIPAFDQEVFGPVAPVTRFGTAEEAARLAGGEYGLSLGILTSDVMRGLELAEHIPTGLVHINDQTVNDEANVPFGGIGASGTGARFGGARANIEAFTETRWTTVRPRTAPYPF